MKVFAESDSKAKRGIVIVGGLLAALSILGLALLMLAPERSQGARGPGRPKARNLQGEASPAAGEAINQQASGHDEEAADPAIVARAMDSSNTRALVRTLLEAAATENTALASSMVSALSRYGGSARPALEEEIGRAPSPRVRRVLEDALRRIN